ncbi:protein FAR1-RELATED SEQUENCE 5-like isoform X1 [Prunus yedoensis var. nudiflora]|uniref:Protein FAR1-RELATED SEQUENCE 5-like isoform X1 n=1 Tax=Prunus yedoensis var. nudiflora TaxID=2094558 RepID=A0A314YI40_PRUYE|nr:protein FAR1-RELATED SEQUENCE 5-like isoform X1 [Prunus yedoensis var. nudiflora]
MGQAIGHAQGSGKAVASDSQTVTLMDPLRVRVKGKEKAMDKLKRWCTECSSFPGNNDDTTQSMPNTQSSPILSLMDEFDIYASTSSHPVL